MELRHKNILRLFNLLRTTPRLPCYYGNLGLKEIKPDEKKKKKLKDFITRRIKHLIEEGENISQLFNNNNIDSKVARTLEDPQKTEILMADKKEVLPLNPRK